MIILHPAKGVDAFLIVVEPGRRSLSTAQNIQRLAADIGVTRCYVVGNKVRDDADREFIRAALPPDLPMLGTLPFNANAISADMGGEAVADVAPELLHAAEEIAAALETVTESETP